MTDGDYDGKRTPELSCWFSSSSDRFSLTADVEAAAAPAVPGVEMLIVEAPGSLDRRSVASSNSARV